MLLPKNLPMQRHVKKLRRNFVGINHDVYFDQLPYKVCHDLLPTLLYVDLILQPKLHGRKTKKKNLMETRCRYYYQNSKISIMLVSSRRCYNPCCLCSSIYNSISYTMDIRMKWQWRILFFFLVVVLLLL